MIPNRRHLRIFGICVAAAGTAFLATRQLPFLAAGELFLDDIRIAYFTPPEDQSADVAVITVDEQTVAELPTRSPLDREFLARMVEALGTVRARAIGLDYLFDRPTDADKDHRLTSAIAAANIPVVVAWADQRAGLLPRQSAYIAAFIEESGAIPGNVHFVTEGGKARYFEKWPSGSDAPPAFPIAIAEALDYPVLDSDFERVFRGQPEGEEGDPFATFSAHVLLKSLEKGSDILRRHLVGKIVLVGADLPEDRHATPLDDNTPGVFIHAHAMAQILEQRIQQRSGPILDGLLVLLIAALATGLVLIDRSPVPKLGLAAIGIAALWAGSWALFYLGGPLIPLLASTLGLVAGYGIGSIGHERTQKIDIRKSFAQFLAPELVEELAAHPERLKLGGEIRDMTIMFMDIRGFTTLSEALTPQQLTGFINDFLTPMSEIILNSRGTIDKYIGDCIMAFWNAPLDDPDNARNACRAALAMLAALNRLNRSDVVRTLPGSPARQIAIGIGLNSGQCSVGNMGSKQRFAYSAMGDTVNLAARLEGQSKTYGVDIVIGEATAGKAAGLATLELDLITVKGKLRPIHIHALLGDERLCEDAAFGALADAHRAMLAAYRTQDWDAAEAAVARCRRQYPDAGIDLASMYDMYAARIADYRAEPPTPDWGGVYVATSK